MFEINPSKKKKKKKTKNKSSTHNNKKKRKQITNNINQRNDNKNKSRNNNNNKVNEEEFKKKKKRKRTNFQDEKTKNTFNLLMRKAVQQDQTEQSSIDVISNNVNFAADIKFNTGTKSTLLDDYAEIFDEASNNDNNTTTTTTNNNSSSTNSSSNNSDNNEDEKKRNNNNNNNNENELVITYKRQSNQLFLPTETHPSKLIEKDSKMEPMPLVRRKLNDNVMSEFLIGNTFARTLLTKEEANLVDEHSILKLLWVGCGDIRNPLTTLKMLKKNQKVHLFFNDISIVTLARDILLLTMLTFNYDDHHGEDKSTLYDVVISIWGDLLLTSKAKLLLNKTIKQLLTLKSFPIYLNITNDTWKSCCMHWKVWLTKNDSKSTKELVKIRQSKINKNKKNIGHGRAGVSTSWKKYGMSTQMYTKDLHICINPTFFNFFVNGNVECLETQSTSGSFRNLGNPNNEKKFNENLKIVWYPLYDRFISSIKNASLRIFFKHGDGLKAVQDAYLRGTKFHAIDTSNVMDYVGVWNLLLATYKALTPPKKAITSNSTTKNNNSKSNNNNNVFSNGSSSSSSSSSRHSNNNKYNKKIKNSKKYYKHNKDENNDFAWAPFIFTEQIMSMSTSINDMLVADLPPFDLKFSKKILNLLNIDIQALPDKLKVDKREKVIHARWVIIQSIKKKNVKERNAVEDNGVTIFNSNKIDEELISGCFDMMKDIFDPRHMTAEMVETCKYYIYI